jgi:hypothetical protein
MTGNGTARGRIIPTLAVRTMAAASPAERVQIDQDALPEGAAPAEKAEILRGLIVRHPHGTVHAPMRSAQSPPRLPRAPCFTTAWSRPRTGPTPRTAPVPRSSSA